MAIALLYFAAPRCHAEAALLLEEPYGFFGALNPTGHTAIYFERVCAETPTKLRRCQPGEMGAVVSRYQGLDGYDWLAVPLIPYLYSVGDASQVPARVSRASVNRMRDSYHEAFLQSLGPDLRRGDFLHGGWTELIGVAYERRIYAIRFETTEAQDDALIAQMNDLANQSRFHLLFNNCADFAREVLNQYFPGTFKRSLFPDAGMTTPKQITYRLERYGSKHPETHVTIFEIPQIPGYRRSSRSNKNISESLITTVYAVPIALMNPYLAGGLFVDYLVRSRYHLIPKDSQVLYPENIEALTFTAGREQNPESANAQAPRAVVNGPSDRIPTATANSGLKEITVEHE